MLPHDQDTGGFFIAIIEKVTELSAESQESAHAALTSAAGEPPPKKAKRGAAYRKEESFTFIDREDDPEWIAIRYALMYNNNSVYQK